MRDYAENMEINQNVLEKRQSKLVTIWSTSSIILKNSCVYGLLIATQSKIRFCRDSLNHGVSFHPSLGSCIHGFIVQNASFLNS